MAKELTTGQAAGAMELVTPEFSTRSTGITEPFLPANPPFLLVFDPMRWTVMQGLLIPGLITVPLERGVQNVDMGKDKKYRIAALRAKIEDQGRRIIPYAWAPNGTSYIQKVTTRPEGRRDTAVAHISVWEKYEPGSRDTYPDEKAYAEWAAGLVAPDKLPACPPHVARRMLEKVEERLREEQAKAEKGGAGSGSASLRAKALAEEFDVLSKAASTGSGEGEAFVPDLDEDPGE